MLVKKKNSKTMKNKNWKQSMEKSSLLSLLEPYFDQDVVSPDCGQYIESSLYIRVHIAKY